MPYQLLDLRTNLTVDSGRPDGNSFSGYGYSAAQHDSGMNPYVSIFALHLVATSHGAVIFCFCHSLETDLCDV